MEQINRDICIIGAGIVGTAIARRLSRYRLDITLLEKADDVAMGATKANSAIVHGGYAESCQTLKGRLCYQGRRQFPQLEQELRFGFLPIGSLVLAFREEDLPNLRKLEANGRANGLTDLQILTGSQIRELEPAVRQDVRYGLYCEGAGVCSPYGMAIALAENAVQNGVELSQREEVLAIRPDGNGYVLTTSRRRIRTKFVINCAGIQAAQVAAMVGQDHFSIRPRSGEYILCRQGTGHLVRKVLFQMPSASGKGILVTPTVHGNLLIGPDAVDTDAADRSTHVHRLCQIFRQARQSVPELDPGWFLRSFAGIRAVSSTDDFIVEESEAPGFFQAAGIQSPGLTAAPAIADRMVELLRKAGCPLVEDPGYQPNRMPLADQPTGSGQILCRCEQVSPAILADILGRGIPILSVDAVKRRTRASMGTCQGNYCRPRFQKLLEDLTGEPLDPRTDIEKEGIPRVSREEFLRQFREGK